MKYWYRKPHPSLAPYVRTVLLLEGFSPPGDARLPFFTNGMPALFCRTERTGGETEEITRLTLFGKSVPADCWEVNAGTTVIAFFFQPFVMPALFNLPAKQLIQPVDLGEWHAHKTNALRIQLMAAPSTQQKTEALESLLLLQLEQQGRVCGLIQRAIDELLHDHGTEALAAVLKKLDLTERTFQRLFKKFVGITPGQYRRICQFQLSFSQLKANNYNTLADVAYDNGFSDQSHFIRAFREFTQLTPQAYLRAGLKKDP